MPRLQNGGFETHTFGVGPWFPPSNGQQLGDNWYYSAGGGGSNGTYVFLNSGAGHSGTYSMQITQAFNGPFSPAMFVYQDISSYTDYLGVEVTLNLYFHNLNLTVANFAIGIDDGISMTTYTLPSPPVNGWQTATVSHTVSMSASKLQVKIFPRNDGGTGAILFDDASLDLAYVTELDDSIGSSENFQAAEDNFFSLGVADSQGSVDGLSLVRHADARDFDEDIAVTDALSFLFNPMLQMSLSDAVACTDATTMIQTKGFSETLLLQDWLRVRKSIPESDWSN